jgi:hypothetical protein
MRDMLSWKERYLCAARHREPDLVPISPETFYYIPVRVSGYRCQEVAPVGLTLPFHRIKTWEAQLQCARYFDFCGWIMPAVGLARDGVETETRIEERADGSKVVTLIHHTAQGPLEEKYWFPLDDACWHVERCVKDPQRDWLRYAELFFADPWAADLSEVEEAYEQTGGQGIVSVYVGSPFTDWLCGAREGGYQTVILELLENPEFFRTLQARYIEYIREKTRMLCERARFDELFMGNEYSELPLLSPRLWREWDLPVLRAFCEVASEYGRPTHWHQHGMVSAILPDFADSGLTILCPLERPPGGDVDLARVKRLYGERLCLKGNVETNLLLNGTPEQVRAQVRECIEAAAWGGGYILGTGDQVARDTPFANLWALIEAGLEYGRY